MLPADLHRRASGVALAWGLLVALLVLAALGALAFTQGWSPLGILAGAAAVLLAIVAASWILMTGR